MFSAENENGTKIEISCMAAVQLPENLFELANDRCCDSRHCAHYRS